MAAAKYASAGMPTIKNVAKITGRERGTVLIHFTANQWAKAIKGAIDGRVAGIRRPSSGLFLMNTPIIPHGTGIPNPNPFPGPEPPDFPPTFVDQILNAFCACERTGYCGNSVTTTDPGSFTVTCKCYCPPETDLGGQMIEGCRPVFSEEKWTCAGGCPKESTCFRVFWPTGVRLLDDHSVRIWRCMCLRLRRVELERIERAIIG